MFEMIEAFERSGLRELVTGYLGERPALSVQKCTMRRVAPDAGNNGWHQDGAFLGDVRALNVWLSPLTMRRRGARASTSSRGGSTTSSRPGPRAPPSTGRSRPRSPRTSPGDVPIVRPIFEPGDMLLFDDLFLHKTAASTEMPNSRYAVESWFFGPSAFPDEYVPIAY